MPPREWNAFVAEDEDALRIGHEDAPVFELGYASNPALEFAGSAPDATDGSHELSGTVELGERRAITARDGGVIQVDNEEAAVETCKQ
jgi:hypothetical protein